MTKNISIMYYENMKEFIKEANKVDGDVLVYRGKFTVDGKSTMGVMSIGLSPVTVEYPDDAIEFDHFLEWYRV